MVKGYELRMTGVALFVLAPISLFDPISFPTGISFLLFAMALVCIALGVAQKKRAESNGGIDQSIFVAIPLVMIILSALVCLTWLI
jgi:hypothetical protein